MQDNTAIGFFIWGVDNQGYGPVELPTLINWVREERVLAGTWVYVEKDTRWFRAADVPELKMIFERKAAAAQSGRASESLSASGLKLGSFRRVKILRDLSDEQLLRFVDYLELTKADAFSTVVEQGDHGDSMFLVLEGELRVRQMIGGKETVLVTLLAGEFFGEIALFDHGPRSADVVANMDSVLLKISSDKFERLLKEAPEVAAPFLLAVTKTLTARIRADNKRYRDSVAFARGAGN